MSYFKENLFLKYFGTVQVPLIGTVKPKIIKIGGNETIIKLPLNRKNKNHLKSMYFGALCIGADLSGGILAMNLIQKTQKNIHLSFKDFKADFKKRAMADTYFYNNQGVEVEKFIEEVITSRGQRMNFSLEIDARCPQLSDEIVASFKLTLSLKYKPTQSE